MTWACFAGVTPWEAPVNGRKTVGLEQCENRAGVLEVAGMYLSCAPRQRGLGSRALAVMSVALAVQMKGLGLALWPATYR